MASEDIERAAWVISARHLARGQKDVTLMIVDAIRIERERCAKIAEDFTARAIAAAIRHAEAG